MNEQQYHELKDECESLKIINTNELWDKTPRTLLIGHTVDFNRWHLYIDEKRKLWLVIYNVEYPVGRGQAVSRCFGHKADIEELFNTKLNKLSPEWCDYSFARLLWQRGVKLPFKTFDSDREASSIASKKIFFGSRAPDDENKDKLYDTNEVIKNE